MTIFNPPKPGLTNPMTTLGDMIYENGTPAPDRVPGNTTTTQKFLSQTGTGSVSATPSWQVIPAQGSLTYYLTDTASSISTYLQQTTSPYTPKTTLSFTGVNTTRVLQNFSTNAGFPGLTFIPAGQFEFHIHASATSPGGVEIYAEFWEVSSTGVDIGLIGTTETTATLGGLTTSEAEYRLFFVRANTYNMTSSASRIVCRVWALRTNATHTIDLYVGVEADSHISLPSNTVDATNFVPYSGAVYDVDLGTHQLTANNIISEVIDDTTLVVTGAMTPDVTGTYTKQVGLVNGYAYWIRDDNDYSIYHLPNLGFYKTWAIYDTPGGASPYFWAGTIGQVNVAGTYLPLAGGATGNPIINYTVQPYATNNPLLNTNLNADMVDGKHATDFATSAQGALADTALQNISGQDLSTADNSTSQFITLADVPDISIHTDGSSTTTQIIPFAQGISANQVLDSSINVAIDVDNRILYASDGTTPVLDWSSPSSLAVSRICYWTGSSSGNLQDPNNWLNGLLPTEFDIAVNDYALYQSTQPNRSGIKVKTFIFKNGAQLYAGGYIYGDAYFYDNSQINPANAPTTIYGDAYFFGTSQTGGNGTIITGNAEFCDQSVNWYYSVIKGDAVFNHTTTNYGVIAGSAIFNDSAVNGGAVSIDLSNKILYADDGTTAMVDYSTVANGVAFNPNGTYQAFLGNETNGYAGSFTSSSNSVYLASNQGTPYAINATGTSLFSNSSDVEAGRFQNSYTFGSYVTATLASAYEAGYFADINNGNSVKLADVTNTYAVNAIGASLFTGSGNQNVLIAAFTESNARAFGNNKHAGYFGNTDINNAAVFGSADGAGDFYDGGSNEVRLADGTYAINATGNMVFQSGGIVDNSTSPGLLSIDTNNRVLYASDGTTRTIAYDKASDYQSTGNHSYISFDNSQNVRLDSGGIAMETYIYDNQTSIAKSIDPNNRLLYADDGTTPIISYTGNSSDGAILSFPNTTYKWMMIDGYIVDNQVSNKASIDTNLRELYDSSEIYSVNYDTRTLYRADGATPAISWDGYGGGNDSINLFSTATDNDKSINFLGTTTTGQITYTTSSGLFYFAQPIGDGGFKTIDTTNSQLFSPLSSDVTVDWSQGGLQVFNKYAYSNDYSNVSIASGLSDLFEIIVDTTANLNYGFGAYGASGNVNMITGNSVTPASAMLVADASYNYQSLFAPTQDFLNSVPASASFYYSALGTGVTLVDAQGYSVYARGFGQFNDMASASTINFFAVNNNAMSIMADTGYQGLQVDDSSGNDVLICNNNGVALSALDDTSNWNSSLSSSAGGYAGYFQDISGGTTVYLASNQGTPYAVDSVGSVKMQGLTSGIGAPATILTNYELYVDTVTGLVYCN